MNMSADANRTGVTDDRLPRRSARNVDSLHSASALLCVSLSIDSGNQVFDPGDAEISSRHLWLPTDSTETPRRARTSNDIVAQWSLALIVDSRYLIRTSSCSDRNERGQGSRRK